MQRANHSEYGLAGGVQTTDPKKAAYVARTLDVGLMWIGKTYNRFDERVPFEGHRASGYGAGLGRRGFEEFAKIKSLYLPHGYEQVIDLYGQDLDSLLE